ncbi:MAG: type IX secretion system protein PorQ [Chitinophagaceae bacterium]|nr:MAG: type IX secretion system protein PorQ [Chitinophagaceae bacterium]
MTRCLLILFFLATLVPGSSQTPGGSSVFNFLKFSGSPQHTALGGDNISNQTDDIGMVFYNPSLLKAHMHSAASFSFTSLYAGVNSYQLQAAYRSEKLGTNFGFGVNYLNYGSVAGTDASGNLLGEIKPADYVLQLSASRAYLQRWTYGGTVKFIHSNYGIYRSSGIAMDLAVTYLDTASRVQASLVVANMGTQLRTYTGGNNKEELPFDLKLGISKRLINAPVQFSFTANRLHRFDVTYNDSAFNAENGFQQPGKKFSIDNIFRHIVISTQIYIGQHLELTAGYNYLRRKELNIGSAANGLNGFSVGAGVLFRTLQLRYGRAYYQSNRSFHQVAINNQLLFTSKYCL